MDIRGDNGLALAVVILEPHIIGLSLIGFMVRLVAINSESTTGKNQINDDIEGYKNMIWKPVAALRAFLCFAE